MNIHRNRSFLARTMGRDEKMIAVAHMHWLYLLIGFFWFITLGAIGVWLDNWLWIYFESAIPPENRAIFGYQFASRSALIKWAAVLTGLFVFLRHLTVYSTTRVGLTNRRLLLRTGLIFVEVDEVDLEEIKSARINHGLLGRFLNYGEIHFDARFVGDVDFPDIADPYPFLRRMHEMCARLSDSMHDTFRGRPDEGLPGDGRLVQETEDYLVYKKPRNTPPPSSLN